MMTTRAKRIVVALGLAFAALLAALAAWRLTTPITPLPNELPVEATAERSGWRFAYPLSGVESQELFLPVGRPVLFKATSLDHARTFRVPEFRIKRKAVAGRWTTVRFTPAEIGDYLLRCTDGCADSPAASDAAVHVVEPMAFESWLAQQPERTAPGSELTPPDRGGQLAQTSGCLGCHSVDGSELVGPTWLRVYGTQRRLEDGSSVAVDDPYLADSIRDPGRQIAAGYPNIMPPAYTMFSEQDIQAIVAYIESLR